MKKKNVKATQPLSEIPFKRFNRSTRNYHPGESPGDYEEPTGVSITVPDQTLSLRTLLDRHTRGLPVPMNQGTYSDQDLPDLNRLDFTEIDALKEANRDDIQYYRERLKEEKPAPTTPTATENTDSPLPPQ